MLTFDRYLRPASLEEAYEAAQKKNNVVLGGGLWLRLGKRRYGTVIDLSLLGLDQIEETEDYYRIGAYVSLRTLETHAELNDRFDGVLAEAMRAIVGVQFRNLATVGGSVFGRFGFSDILTVMLALDASVELYPTGIVSLEDFCRMGKTRDILTYVRIPKQSLKVSYRAHRNSATDLPVLNVCAVRCRDRLTVSIGARPARAVAYRFTLNGVAKPADESVRIAKEIADAATFDSNTRATAQYRRHLCRVLVGRAINDVLTEEMV